MQTDESSVDYEQELVDLLEELSLVQDELLEVLSVKRQCMASGDLEGMTSLQDKEESLGQRLNVCHQRRQQLLDSAAAKGLPHDTLDHLAAAVSPDPSVSPEGEPSLGRRVKQVAGRMKLLQHQSLTNWVLAQRSLLHLSQMIEILATGGRIQPTYTSGEATTSRGALMDQEA